MRLARIVLDELPLFEYILSVTVKETSSPETTQPKSRPLCASTSRNSRYVTPSPRSINCISSRQNPRTPGAGKLRCHRLSVDRQRHEDPEGVHLGLRVDDVEGVGRQCPQPDQLRGGGSHERADDQEYLERITRGRRFGPAGDRSFRLASSHGREGHATDGVAARGDPQHREGLQGR